MHSLCAAHTPEYRFVVTSLVAARHRPTDGRRTHLTMTSLNAQSTSAESRVDANIAGVRPPSDVSPRRVRPTWLRAISATFDGAD